ncbi:hypothetical protein [Nocardia sp. NPDC050793]|uniref:hypothetical protein n=1 Tax=Nocardia sp. NPDC050793 TaxID=3155159 RepID=UPI0034037E65
MTVQVHWSDIHGECLDLFYRACVTAARRFVAAFNETHAEDIAIVYSRVGPRLLPRLPCERNWSIP